jgi:hypothetical protein
MLFFTAPHIHITKLMSSQQISGYSIYELSLHSLYKVINTNVQVKQVLWEMTNAKTSFTFSLNHSYRKRVTATKSNQSTWSIKRSWVLEYEKMGMVSAWLGLSIFHT